MTAIPLIVMSTFSFAIAAAFISGYRPGDSRSDPGVARIVRSTRRGLIHYLALILALPGIFGNVPGHWAKQLTAIAAIGPPRRDG
jgi:hypothetical protein